MGNTTSSVTSSMPGAESLPRAPYARQIADHSESQPCLQRGAVRAARTINRAQRSAERIYEQVRTRLARGTSSAITESRVLWKRSQTRLQHVKREHPVQMLGILAGAAFLTGVAIRVGRSRT